MKQYRRGRTTRTVFEHPYESVKWTADQNYAHLCTDAAIELYREALKLARNNVDREDCMRGLMLCGVKA